MQTNLILKIENSIRHDVYEITFSYNYYVDRLKVTFGYNQR